MSAPLRRRQPHQLAWDILFQIKILIHFTTRYKRKERFEIIQTGHLREDAIELSLQMMNTQGPGIVSWTINMVVSVTKNVARYKLTAGRQFQRRLWMDG